MNLKQENTSSWHMKSILTAERYIMDYWSWKVCVLYRSIIDLYHVNFTTLKININCEKAKVVIYFLSILVCVRDILVCVRDILVCVRALVCVCDKKWRQNRHFGPSYFAKGPFTKNLNKNPDSFANCKGCCHRYAEIQALLPVRSN